MRGTFRRPICRSSAVGDDLRSRLHRATVNELLCGRLLGSRSTIRPSCVAALAAALGVAEASSNIERIVAESRSNRQQCRTGMQAPKA